MKKRKPRGRDWKVGVPAYITTILDDPAKKHIPDFLDQEVDVNIIRALLNHPERALPDRNQAEDTDMPIRDINEELYALIATKAETDPGYAIAFALLQITEILDPMEHHIYVVRRYFEKMESKGE